MKAAALSFVTTKYSHTIRDKTTSQSWTQAHHPVHDENEQKVKTRPLRLTPDFPVECELETRKPLPGSIKAKTRKDNNVSLWRKFKNFANALSSALPDISQRNIEWLTIKQIEKASGSTGAEEEQDKTGSKIEQERIERYKAGGL